MQQSTRKIFLRKLELKEQVSYFSTPEAVGKLSVHAAIGLSMNC
jgi:hypothetical protein